VVLGSFGIGTAVAFALIAALLFGLFRPAPKDNTANAQAAPAAA